MNDLSQTIFFLDFDHMLFDTDRFFHVDVKKEFARLGVDIATWEGTYMDVCLSGYTLAKHAAAMHRASHGEVPLHEMERIIEQRFSDLGKYLFEDVVPFLSSMQDLGAELAILSFGNPEWQRYKVEASGIVPFFRDIHFTGRHSSKFEVMRSYVGLYRSVFFVDNHPNELDGVRESGEAITTFLMDRVPCEEILATLPIGSFFEAKKYGQILPRHHHVQCTNLQEVINSAVSL